MRPVEVIVLGRPHLVLADVSDHDGLPLGRFPQGVDDLGGYDVLIIRLVHNVTLMAFALPVGNLLQPLLMGGRLHQGQELFHHLAQVSQNSHVHRHDLVQFR